MINKVGLGQVQFRPAFRAKEEGEVQTVTNPQQEVSFKGTEALGNYNRAKVFAFDKSLLNVEPMEPIMANPNDIDSIEGERIYTSEGKLNSIVNRVGDTITTYTPAEDNENMIDSIEIKDKKTGAIIKGQYNYNDDNGENRISVNEYDPETGNNVRMTDYVNGELSYASKTIQKPNRMIQDIDFDYETGKYSVTERDEDRSYHKHYEFNKNKELTAIYEDKDNYKVNSEVHFYDGAIISAEKSKRVTIPNDMGKEVLNDADLQPSEIPGYPETIEGEKTYYSNGALESINNGELLYNYSPDGDLTSIKDGNKTLNIYSDAKELIENLDENITKTTLYDDERDAMTVEYKDGDYLKSLYFRDGKIRNYDECQGDQRVKSLDFDENGNLEHAWGEEV